MLISNPRHHNLTFLLLLLFPSLFPPFSLLPIPQYPPSPLPISLRPRCFFGEFVKSTICWNLDWSFGSLNLDVTTTFERLNPALLRYPSNITSFNLSSYNDSFHSLLKPQFWLLEVQHVLHTRLNSRFGIPEWQIIRGPSLV